MVDGSGAVEIPDMSYRKPEPWGEQRTGTVPADGRSAGRGRGCGHEGGLALAHP
jgi:hypothetical protein